MVGWCGRAEVQRGKRIAGLDGIGVGPTTKAAPVADGELYRWLCVRLVRVQLLPTAENAQLSRESPRICCLLQQPRGRCVAILMTSHTLSMSIYHKVNINVLMYFNVNVIMYYYYIYSIIIFYNHTLLQCACTLSCTCTIQSTGLYMYRLHGHA